MKSHPGKVFPRVVAMVALISLGAAVAGHAGGKVVVWSNRVSLTNVPPGLTNIIALAAGRDHLLALTSEGRVAAWGGNTQLGDFPATNVPPVLSGVTAIAAGSTHSLALKSDGTVVAWGDNKYGQTNVSLGLSNVIAVAAGNYQSLALKTDGRVVAWGAKGISFPPYNYNMLTNVPAGLSNVAGIAAGFDHNLALKSDGQVVAWGFSGVSSVPVDVTNAIAVACGQVGSISTSMTTFDLALRADDAIAPRREGPVVFWVTGTYVQLGYPWISPWPPPSGLSNVVAIAAGGHGMALRADGSMTIWGLTNPPPPAGLSNIIGIAAGYGFAAAITGDGSPFFTLQPVGQTVARGSKVQFHARATGVQPLSYRWQLDGGNLTGATNASLILTNVQGRDTGDYRVVIANALGSATSAAATLTIPFSADLAAALNATNLVWTTSPTNAPWFAQIRDTHDGDVAAQSGRIGHNQQSALHATVVGPGTLTFWWKVSSEEEYDRLWFGMDYLNWATWISGETEWRQFTFHVPAGSHVLRWAYVKDSTVSTGQDVGWLDEVVFAPASPQMLASPFILPDGSLAFTASDIGDRTLLPYNLAFIEIQVSTNLRDWTTLVNACTLTNGSLLIRDPDRAHYPHRFYRIVEH